MICVIFVGNFNQKTKAMSKKLGQEPAYPCEVTISPIGALKEQTIDHKGMSKRFYTACAAMQGMLSNSNSDVIGLTTQQIVSISYECADELLKQEQCEPSK